LVLDNSLVDVRVADMADYVRRVFEEEFGSASTTQTGPSDQSR
jgi:hypothetical protein